MRSFNLVAAATVIVLAVGGSVFVLSNRSSDPGEHPAICRAIPGGLPERGFAGRHAARQA